MVSTAVERIPPRDHAVGLDGRGAVLGEPEALAHHHVGVGKRAIGIAVDEPAVAREVGADLLVQDRRVRLQRPLRVDHRRQRLVVDRHHLGGVLGQVAIARDHHRHRLTDEAHLVDGRRIVVDGGGHAHTEGLAGLGHVGSGDRADDTFHGQRRCQVVPENARVGVGRAHDGGVAEVGHRRVIVDEGAATGQQPAVLHAWYRTADPALGHGRCTLVSAHERCQGWRDARRPRQYSPRHRSTTARARSQS